MIPGAALGILGPGGQVVGEHTGGAAEHIVLQLHPLVQGDIILQLAAVTHLYMVADIHVLPQGAALADTGPLLNVAEVPDLGALADLHILIHKAGGMHKILLLHHSASRTASMIVCCWAASIYGCMGRDRVLAQ